MNVREIGLHHYICISILIEWKKGFLYRILWISLQALSVDITRKNFGEKDFFKLIGGKKIVSEFSFFFFFFEGGGGGER
jgi:hypothetical protein